MKAQHKPILLLASLLVLAAVVVFALRLINRGVTPAVPKYQVVYSLNNLRPDGGASLYVLLDDLNTDELNDRIFRNIRASIEALVKELVKTRGPKTSIKIYDVEAALELDKSNDETSGGVSITDEDYEMLELHHIADFIGEAPQEQYRNTLKFFPSAGKGAAKVGNYVETVAAEI